MRRIAVSVVAAALTAVVGVYGYSTYAAWGGLGPGAPARVTWCGRTYLPANETFTLDQVTINVDRSAHDGNPREIARTPWGDAVLAAPMSPAQQASLHTQVCAMAVYVSTGPDTYRPYELSGGP